MMYQFNNGVGYIRRYRHPGHLMPQVPPVIYRTRREQAEEIVLKLLLGGALVVMAALGVFVGMYAI